MSNQIITLQYSDRFHQEITSRDFSLLLHGSIEGTQLSIQDSYYFFSGGKVRFIDHWSPGSYNIYSQDLRVMIPHIDDKVLHSACLSFQEQVKEFQQLENELIGSFSAYYGKASITTRELIKHRKKYGHHQAPEWLRHPEIKSLVNRMEQVVQVVLPLTTQILSKLKTVYPDLRVLGEELGSQDAKELIDMADGVGLSPNEAIQLLEKALSYGTTGMFASKAYTRLAMWYEDLGDTAKAIEHYGLSMNAWREYPYAYYVCGRLYHEQQRYIEALSSIRKALEFPPDEWGEVEDYEKAKQLLRTLESYI